MQNFCTNCITETFANKDCNYKNIAKLKIYINNQKTLKYEEDFKNQVITLKSAMILIHSNCTVYISDLISVFAKPFSLKQDQDHQIIAKLLFFYSIVITVANFYTNAILFRDWIYKKRANIYRLIITCSPLNSSISFLWSSLCLLDRMLVFSNSIVNLKNQSINKSI